MAPEYIIKNEMRIFALESIVCQFIASYYATQPRQIFDAAQSLAVSAAQRQTFGGDAAESDLYSAELQAAFERLYGMTRHYLSKVKR
jgi:hypothetical protein